MFNSPTAARLDNAPQIVTCEADEHTPRGTVPAPHQITADCTHPRSAGPVICDAHSAPGARFPKHAQRRTCKNPVLTGGAEK